MRAQLVAAKTVAEALADLATSPEPATTPASSEAPIMEIAGPREESLVEMATLLAARRADPVRIEGASEPADPDRELFETDGLLPGPDATLAGPAFRGLARLDHGPEVTDRVVSTTRSGRPSRELGRS